MKVGDYVKVEPRAFGFIVPKPPTVRFTTRPDAIYVLLTKTHSECVGRILAFKPEAIEVISEGG